MCLTKRKRRRELGLCQESREKRGEAMVRARRREGVEFENSYNIDPSCNVLNKRVVMRVTSDYKRIASLRAWATCIVYNCSSEFRTATRCRGWWLIWVADITFTVTRTSCSGVETVSKTLSIQIDLPALLIFMDEIDAIGGRRFSEGTSADREIHRTLMELLNQLGKEVKMIMATNRPDVLDPDPLRPGRLGYSFIFKLVVVKF
ncbi:hypothetical protein Sjap_021610 [Stephania japonica]|uniref:ATPase AAA-type core domain-containing protein n=1 Tax=Stephania japonica TaxID=461633 RepID=A0AAP0EUH5_9MAGN